MTKTAFAAVASLLIAVGPAGAASLPADPGAGSLDVISDLLAGPTSLPSQGRVAIFRDTHFGDGTGCIFSYATEPSLQRLPAGAEALRAFRSPGWSVINWHWQNSTRRIFSQDLPNLCSDEAQVGRQPGSEAIWVDYGGQRAETLDVGRGGLVLQLDSVPYYRKMFGRPYYPASNKVTWPLLELMDKFRFRRISDYSSIRLTFKAQLLESDVSHEPREGGPLPPGASEFFNPGVNATRLELSIPLRWHPRECNGAPSAPAECRLYFNKPINVLIFFYDDRWEYWDKTPITRDPGTANFGNVFIYRVGARELIPGAPARNPFKVVGAQATASADILPLLRKVIASARRQSDLDGVDYVPPRLTRGGAPETDDQFVRDFAISDMGLAYENSGLGNVSFKIRELSLVGIRSAPKPLGPR
ncbi:MAG TPA: hypothetical protein VGS12_00805 [Caulobacteraceae bacterium]|nr:hypothetical protein [Caulobacteraceae bacterium]